MTHIIKPNINGTSVFNTNTTYYCSLHHSTTSVSLFPNMFANRTAESAALRGNVDENASASSSKLKTPASTKTPKRRAFGDISNRKNNNTTNKNTIKKTPHVSIVPTNTTKTNNRKKSGIVPPSSSRRSKSVTFAPTITTTNTKKLSIVPPVEDVELSAGRTWSEQLALEQEDDDDWEVKEILQEQAEWNKEVSLFMEEERARHLRIRQFQAKQAEKELQAKMEALWKQDEQDLAEDLDHLVLESVPSFDDLSLDKEDFGGSYSFPDDISF